MRTGGTCDGRTICRRALPYANPRGRPRCRLMEAKVLIIGLGGLAAEVGYGRVNSLSYDSSRYAPLRSLLQAAFQAEIVNGRSCADP